MGREDNQNLAILKVDEQVDYIVREGTATIWNCFWKMVLKSNWMIWLMTKNFYYKYLKFNFTYYK